MGILNMIHFNYTPLLEELASLIACCQRLRGRAFQSLEPNGWKKTWTGSWKKKLTFMRMNENQVDISMENMVKCWQVGLWSFFLIYISYIFPIYIVHVICIVYSHTNSEKLVLLIYCMDWDHELIFNMKWNVNVWNILCEGKNCTSCSSKTALQLNTLCTCTVTLVKPSVISVFMR